MHKKNWLPMAAVALVVVIGFEKYKAGAFAKAAGPGFKIGV